MGSIGGCVFGLDVTLGVYVRHTTSDMAQTQLLANRRFLQVGKALKLYNVIMSGDSFRMLNALRYAPHNINIPTGNRFVTSRMRTHPKGEGGEGSMVGQNNSQEQYFIFTA